MLYRQHIELEEKIKHKLDLIIELFGELRYEIIEHSKCNEPLSKLNIIEAKKIIGEYKSNDFLVQCGTFPIIKESSADKRNYTFKQYENDIMHYYVFDKDAIWITFKDIESFDIDDIKDYFECVVVRYAIEKKWKIPKVNLYKSEDINLMLDIFAKAFTSKEADYMYGSFLPFS